MLGIESRGKKNGASSDCIKIILYTSVQTLLFPHSLSCKYSVKREIFSKSLCSACIDAMNFDLLGDTRFNFFMLI